MLSWCVAPVRVLGSSFRQLGRSVWVPVCDDRLVVAPNYRGYHTDVTMTRGLNTIHKVEQWEQVRATRWLVYNLGQACPFHDVPVQQLIDIPGQDDIRHRKVVADLSNARVDELQQVFRRVDWPRWVVLCSDEHVVRRSLGRC